jgi:carboxymethylenebutenolidase
MMRVVKFAALLVFASTLSCTATAQPSNGSNGRRDVGGPVASPASKNEVVFQSGELSLHGVLYVPRGSGPFPAVLWNHGAWRDPMVAFDRLAPTFTERGWVFFGPFRRGQGLSSAAGPFIEDEIDHAKQSGGPNAAAAKAVSLLTGEHLDEQLAAYAWLKRQPYVVAQRIAVAGNSFGGIEAVLGAERVPYCAAIDGAGASMSWAEAPELREAMIRAARSSRAPLLLFQAANDVDLSPSRTLSSEMRAAGKTVELQIYPPYGSTPGEGHNFAWLGSAIWGRDVLEFLQHHCGG